MNFDDVYKTMLLKRGGSVKNSDIKNSKDSINRQFENDPSYKLGKLIKNKLNEEIDLDTRLVNNDNNPLEKKIYVRPDINLDVGDYIKYPDITYLVLEVENNLISPRANSTKCNHILKWMYKGELYECPAIVSNNTKYTEGTKTQVVGITEQSAMFNVQVPDMLKTKMLGLDQRFIINDMAWRVTLPDRTNDGLLILTLGKSSINTETDDTDNEIANRWEVIHNYNTTCDNSISITKGGNYNLVYSFNDNNQPIDSNLITVENSSNLISVIKSNDGKISITGIDIGTGSFKVKLNLTDEIREFVVNFDIVSNVIPDKIEYKVTSSNAYTFIKMVGAEISVQKLINGVADTTLKVDYKVPPNIQTLITNGSLSITTKSDNSIYVRNKSVTTSTTFVIEFFDKATGTKICESPTITLKGA